MRDAMVCALLGGHAKGTNIDPTGGDPWMGGPVLITVCSRCGDQVDTNAEAMAYNEMVRKQWEEEDRVRQPDTPWPPKRRLLWWRK